MSKFLLLFMLLSSTVFAADNAVVLTPGVGVTMRTKDVGSGVQSPYNILGDLTGTTIYGTAGTANANVLSVQGIASMTPILVTLSGTNNIATVTTVSTVTSLTGGGVASGAADSGNPIKVGGKYNLSAITLSDGNRGDLQLDINGYLKINVTNANANGQAVMASSSPVVIASNQTSIPVASTLTAETTKVIGTINVAAAQTIAVTNAGTFAVQSASTLAAETTKVIGTARIADGSGNLYFADPCQRAAKTYTPISITTATTTRIVAPSASNRTYICHLFLTSVAADNIGIVEGTGGTCGSGTAGVIGGTTAANGPNFAANSGMAVGQGGFAIAATAGTNVDLCLITSAATPLAGHIAWVQAP